MAWSFYDQNGKVLQGVLAVSIGATELATDAVTSVKIADDAVTYAKMQNLGTADRVLGSASTGVIGEVQIVSDMLATDAVTNVKVATGIDAVKLANGSVTNAELQYINTLSSNAQDQLTAKAPIASPTFTTGATSPSFITGNSGIIKLMDGNGSNFASIAAHATTTADIAYTWPPAGPGTNGYALTSTTAGVMSWAAGGGDLSFGGNTFDSDKVIGSNNAYDFGFETAGVTRMDITDDGKVGIGTIVPTEPLSVNGTGTGITGTALSTFSTQQDFSPRRGVMLGYDSSGQIGIISATTSSAAADLAFWSYSGGWSEKMRLKHNGNLGIGTASPSTLFHMKGGGAEIATFETTSASAQIAIKLEKVANSTGGTLAYYWVEGSGNGSSGNQGYEMGYAPSTGIFYLWASSGAGSGSATDVFRLPINQGTMDANYTWDSNAFDDYDDALVLERAFSPVHKQTVYEDGKMILKNSSLELIDMGVLRKYEDDWVGYNDQRMAALLAGGIYQTRHRLDDYYEELKAEIKELKAEVDSLKA